MLDDILGWDIGGANLKAARINAAGAVSAVVQIPCPLWRGLPELAQAMRFAIEFVGTSQRHALTMTGEMVDLFPSRSAGVIEIARSVGAILGESDMGVFCGDRQFVSINEVAAVTEKIASANWLASAEFVASKTHTGIFVDIGSTTTDVVAILNSKPHYRGRDDYSRLVSGELVYSGVTRTPLMAIIDHVQFRGDNVAVIAEYFASAADVYRVLGELPENADQHPTADGADKTQLASARRMARMIGRDVETQSMENWCELARSFRWAQLAKINRGIDTVLAQASLPSATPIFGAGVGEFIVREIARERGSNYRSFGQLCEIDGPSEDAVTRVAPATAVALLAQRR